MKRFYFPVSIFLVLFCKVQITSNTAEETKGLFAWKSKFNTGTDRNYWLNDRSNTAHPTLLVLPPLRHLNLECRNEKY
jgi:hypothetical protein